MTPILSTTYRETINFDLSTDLINSLRRSAAKVNCSLNSYVEMVLNNHQYHVPNAETIAAIEEAERGEYAGTFDTSSPEAFIHSILGDEEI